MLHSEGINKTMAYSLATLYLAWSVLELLWGWEIIPGPYSIG